MPHDHSRRTVLATAAILLVLLSIAAHLWLGPGGATTRVGAAPAEEARAPRLAPADLAEASDGTHGARGVANTSEETARRAAPAAEADAHDAAAAPAPVRVRFTLAPTPWLTSDAPLCVTLFMKVDEIAEHELEPEAGSGHVWHLELPALPTGASDVLAADVAGFAVQAVDFEVLDAAAARASGFEAHVALELVPGAHVVWLDQVAFDQRPPVELGLGGSFKPDTTHAATIGRVRGRPLRIEPLELPQRLPRVRTVETLWVGAEGHVWRGYAVGPDTASVEVALVPGAAIRVLHDVPAGERVHAMVSAFDSGDTERQLVVPGAPALFTDRQSHWHRVWLEDAAGERLSRLAVVEAVSGATVDVDLTRASLTEGRGALRVVVTGPAQRLSVAGLEVRLERAAAPGRGRAFEWHDTLEPVERSDDRVVFESVGLDPLLHRVVVEPFGHAADAAIAAGETAVVELSLHDVGTVVFELADGSRTGTYFGLLRSADGPDEMASFAHTGSFTSWPPEPIEVAAGRWVAHFQAFGAFDGEDADPTYVSEPFVVAAGATTTVVLAPQAQAVVHVHAVDATTGEPVGLETEFWVACALVPLGRDEELRGSIAFTGGIGVSSSVTWSVPHHAGAIEFRVPEHALYTFEPVARFEFAGTRSIELRARAK